MVVGVVYGMMCGVTEFPYLVSADSLSGCGLIFVLMSPVTIDSIPSGAGVSIDGEFVGFAPVSVSVAGDLQEFRDTCMADDQVSCGWDVLVVWLEDHRVSGFWWDMTMPERRAVAIKAIENTSPKFGCWAHGESDCAEDTPIWMDACCFHNALVRYLKFKSPLGLTPHQETMDSCYYNTYPDFGCYRPDRWYDLPGHWVTGSSPNWGHFMMSVQVDLDISSMDSWIIFQYEDIDIKPGHWQIPFGTNIHFQIQSHAGCDAGGGTRIASFEV